MLTEAFYLQLAAWLQAPEASHALYLAVGSGSAAWDRLPPSPDRGITRLENEIFRKRLEPGQAFFLDAGNKPSAKPTTRLRFHATLGLSEGIGTLRECGLFLGKDASHRDSGTMLAYAFHQRLTKTDAMEIDRSVRLDLTPRPPGADSAPGRMRYLANSKSKEFHDLDHISTQCKIDSIRVDHRQSFATAEAALALGYDYCGFCFPVGLSRR